MASISVSPHLPRPRTPVERTAALRRWYERGLGWTTAGEATVELPAGVRFDVLEMPADAGFAVLRRGLRTGPVAVDAGLPAQERPVTRGRRAGRRMRLLLAPGSGDEVPGLLEWLEWGGIDLGLTVLGPGDLMTAPWPSALQGFREAAGATARPTWLRPPVPGRAVEPTLPATPPGCAPPAGGATSPSKASGGGLAVGAPDLVRLLGAVAVECHRARLRRSAIQPFAFSYASRTVAGTRPRSLTS